MKKRPDDWIMYDEFTIQVMATRSTLKNKVLRKAVKNYVSGIKFSLPITAPLIVKLEVT